MVEEKEIEMLEIDTMRISREEIKNPDLFLDSERGTEWIEKISSNFYYTQWYNDNRSSYDMKTMNELAKNILEAKYDGKEFGDIIEILEGNFYDYSAEQKYDEEYSSDINNILESISNDLEDMSEDDDTIPEMDIELWEQELRDRIVSKLYNDDDSCVTDMYTSHDRAEVVFYLGSNVYIDSVYSKKNYSDFKQLEIDTNLQSQLAAMGYSISEYRKMSGNKSKSTIKGGVPKRKHPMLTPADLKEIVDNACSSYFDFVVYAIVPISEIIDLDVRKPIVLSNYAVATYNGSSGTFHDVTKKDSIVIYPQEAKLTGVTGYTPDQICGLSHRAYIANIKNLDES